MDQICHHVVASTEKNGIQVLCDTLLKHYPKNHIVTLYEAAQYPHCEPHIDSMPLVDLLNASLSRISTLYIPPLVRAELDLSMVDALNLNYR